MRLSNTVLFTVEVRNLSAFPVTITNVGFYRTGVSLPMEACNPCIVVNFRSRVSLPVRMESRASFSVQANTSEHPGILHRDISAVYVRTACGLTVKGGGRFFKRQRERIAATPQH